MYWYWWKYCVVCYNGLLWAPRVNMSLSSSHVDNWLSLVSMDLMFMCFEIKWSLIFILTANHSIYLSESIRCKWWQQTYKPGYKVFDTYMRPGAYLMKIHWSKILLYAADRPINSLTWPFLTYLISLFHYSVNTTIGNFLWDLVLVLIFKQKRA